MWDTKVNEKSKVCVDDSTVYPVDKCSIPLFNAETSYDLPEYENEFLASIITRY